MALINTSELENDLITIMTQLPEGSALAESWGNAIGKWLSSATLPAIGSPGELKTGIASAISLAIAPAVVLPGSAVEPPSFPTAFNAGLTASTVLILKDEAVLAQISNGVAHTPPTLLFSFEGVTSVGVIQKGSPALVASKFANDLYLWASTGTVSGASWT